MSWPRRLSRALACLALTGVLLTVSGCPDSGLACGGDETVTVKMTGSCAQGTQVFQLRRSGCSLYVWTISDAGAPAPLGLPPSGELSHGGGNVRAGDWSLWGCPMGQEPCPDQFRICTAERVAFQLNLTCVGGTGAPLCEAVLTE